jgi:fatty-acyl-CoA synthase
MLRTISQAVEDAAKAPPALGFRFFSDGGIPGFAPPGATGDAAVASFSYAALERMSARFGGALQALGLRKGDRAALILPANDDFVLCFLACIRAGIVPVPIYPPLALGQLQTYLDNTRHIVAKSGARAIVTTSKIKRLLGTVQDACPDL